MPPRHFVWLSFMTSYSPQVENAGEATGLNWGIEALKAGGTKKPWVFVYVLGVFFSGIFITFSTMNKDHHFGLFCPSMLYSLLSTTSLNPILRICEGHSRIVFFVTWKEWQSIKE